eukprot:CAMPEP_0198257496 /NCGR_PEP_ID=MMETSP1447-20131203/7163_1 /TAXON_ID=420782 /ORGANISM="Chaetoceros dichaeta, Strain CCMP1751" /LENGTH=546 /DNA_ID=CAMNT_0043944415 /DNA_START=83 /DNA_END=1720 /DNA_ORIENTATION=-
MHSVSADNQISSSLTRSLLEKDDVSVSSDYHHDSPKNIVERKSVPLDMEKKEEKEDGVYDEMSVNSGPLDEDWDMVSPLLLSSSTSRVLRSRLRYSESIDDDDETEEVSAHFKDGILPGFVSPLEAFLSVAGGFMALSFACLVLGSFYFSWSDTMLRVNLDTFLANDESNIGPPVQFDVPLYKNATFQTTLSIFQSSHSSMIVLLVIVSALIIPSIWIMVYPILVVRVQKFSIRKYRATNAINRDSRSYFACPLCLSRWWVDIVWTHEQMHQVLTVAEVFMKFSLSIMYVQSILLVCTSRINFTFGRHGASTDYINNEQKTIEGDEEHKIFAQVVNNTRGGSISYLMGISFGVAAAAIIRFHWRRHDNFLKHDSSRISEIDEHDLHMEVQCAESTVRLQERSNGVLSPPTSAFRLLNEAVSENQNGFSGVEPGDGNSEEDNNVLTNSLLVVEETDELTTEENLSHKLRKSKCSTLSTILLIETGILSTILLYPMLKLPLIRLEYIGMTVPLINKTENFLTLWDIVHSVSTDSGDGFLAFIAKVMFW